MTKNTILSLCVAALAIGGVIAIKTCTNVKEVQSQTSSLLDHRDDTIKYWKDRYNSEHAEKETAIGDLVAMDAAYRQEIDSICSREGIKPSQLKSADMIGTVMTGHFQAPVRPDTVRDTVTNTVYVSRKFDYQEHWFQTSGECTDTYISMDWQAEDSLIVPNKIKKAFLKRTLYTSSAYSLNPHVHIKGLTALEIIHKDPGRFGIGPFAGVDVTGRVTLGIAFTYSLIRF